MNYFVPALGFEPRIYHTLSFETTKRTWIHYDVARISRMYIYIAHHFIYERLGGREVKPLAWKLEIRWIKTKWVFYLDFLKSIFIFCTSR